MHSPPPPPLPPTVVAVATAPHHWASPSRCGALYAPVLCAGAVLQWASAPLAMKVTVEGVLWRRLSLTRGRSCGCCTGYLCTTCTTGYYRKANACQACPSYAAPLVSVLVPLVLVVVVVGLVFAPLANSRMSTFGVAINLCQFIGMAGQSDVDWPPALDPFFDLFSWSNLNM